MKSKTLLAFLFITGISWLTYQAFEGSRFLKDQSQFIKHSVNIFFLLAVFSAGYFAFSFYKQTWIRTIWLLLYSLIIAILLLFGFFDLLLTIKAQNIRNMLSGLKMFFCSPLPFVLLIFLSKISSFHLNKSIKTNA